MDPITIPDLSLCEAEAAAVRVALDRTNEELARESEPASAIAWDAVYKQNYAKARRDLGLDPDGGPPTGRIISPSPL